MSIVQSCVNIFSDSEKLEDCQSWTFITKLKNPKKNTHTSNANLLWWLFSAVFEKYDCFVVFSYECFNRKSIYFLATFKNCDTVKWNSAGL